RVVDDVGSVVGEGKDLNVLRESLRSQAGEAIASAGASIERSDLKTWDFGELPRSFTITRAGHEVRGYPALIEEPAPYGKPRSEAPGVFATEPEQLASMRIGLRRLLVLAVPSSTSQPTASLDNNQKLTLGLAPHPTVSALLEDAYDAAVDDIVAQRGGLV